MKPAILPKLLLIAWLSVIAIYLCGCATTDVAKSPDIQPLAEQQRAELLKQNETLKQQNDLLSKQVTALQSAIDAASKAGTLIDQSKAQGSKAAAEAADRPTAVGTLKEQGLTLDQAKAQNQETEAKLKDALADNALLVETNSALGDQNASLITDNGRISDTAKKKDAESIALRGEVSDLKQQVADAKSERLGTYFGLSLGALVLGIAMAIWIPSPAKTVGYVIATVGAVGLAITLFLILWMAVFKWVLLGVFIVGGAYAAWCVFRNHGALTKTAQGVEGIKQDLLNLIASSPVQTVKDEATKLYTDYFGTATQAGIFNWLHSEYESIITRIRSLFDKPAAPAASPAKPS